MRGALAALLAALALGGLSLVSTSGAATVRNAAARATVAIVDGKAFGAVESRRGSVAAPAAAAVDKPNVVLAGEATASTQAKGTVGSATATASGIELLGGRVSADSVTRDADGGEVAGLVVDEQSYGVIRQPRTIALEDGGELILNTGDTGLRLVTDNLDAAIAIADVTTFTREVADPTPTPTETPKPKAKPKRTPTPVPTAPPRLTAGGYAFPVVGAPTYEDTFGADRAPPIISHQGTDVFAEFGSPVVAVRDGRVTKVGTLEISGNRLWVVADNGDAFFYAHLSSFAPAARNGARVEAGDVLGFVGNTGDAEPTPPHVHFEVHPGGIDEDAVNPYPILRSWEEREDVPPGAWVQRLGADATERPGALVTVRDFLAE